MGVFLNILGDPAKFVTSANSSFLNIPLTNISFDDLRNKSGRQLLVSESRNAKEREIDTISISGEYFSVHLQYNMRYQSIYISL